MKKSNIMEAQSITASIWSEKLGVNVVIGGGHAFTNGKTIHLPDLNDQYYKKMMGVLFGLNAHESFHILESDFNIIRQCQSPLEKMVLNIVEDIRIERNGIKKYPGIKRRLDEACKHMLLGNKSPEDDSSDQQPGFVLTNYLLTAGRLKYLKQSFLKNLADKYSQKAEETFGNGFLIRINALMNGVYGLKNSADAYDLTLEVIRMMEELDKEDKQNKDQQNQDQDDQGEDDQNQDSQEAEDSQDDQDQDENSDQDNQANDSDDIDNNDSIDDSQDEDDDNNQGDENDTSAAQQALASDEDDLPDDIYDQLKKELENNAESPEHRLDIAVECSIKSRQPDEVLFKEAKLYSNGIRSQLVSLLQSSKKDRVSFKRTGTNLASSRVYRIKQGQFDVFKTRQHHKKMNTAIQVLVDTSGSMAGSMGIVTQATSALSVALDDIPNLKHSVARFPASPLAGDSVSKLKGFNESAKKVMSAFNMGHIGSTPTTEAMVWAVKELISRKETRKMILLITDGGPDDYFSCKYMIDECIKAGIEVIGIGIHYDITELVPESRIINDINELKKALFDMLGNKLIQ